MNKGYLNGVYQAKTLSILSDESINNLKKLNSDDFLSHLETINYNSIGSNYLLLDECLDLNLKEVRSELERLTNNNTFSDALFFNIDLVNYKIVYKSVKENVDSYRYFNSGKYSYEALEQFILHDNNSLIKEEDFDLFNELKMINEIGLKDNLEHIEKTYFNYYYNASKQLDESLFNYLDFSRFINNLKLLLKFKIEENVDSLLFENLILEETIVSKNEWIYLLTKDEKEIALKFNTLLYGKLEDGVTNFFESNSLIELDLALKKVFDDFMLEKSYNHKSLAPTIYYIYLKLEEQKKLRGAYYE